MESPINPFNELAKSLHAQMANLAALMREVPDFDSLPFRDLHDRYLKLVSETSSLLTETVALREYVSAYRSHAQAFDALEATEAQLHETHQRLLQVKRGEAPQIHSKVTEFPAPENTTGAA